MKTLPFVLVLAAFLSSPAAEYKLVTGPGDYSIGRTTLTVSSSETSPNAINYSVAFRAEVPNTFGPEFGPAILMVTQENSVTNFPVSADRWAFYLASQSELWFYDGFGAFKRFQLGKNGLSLSATCSDPKLGSLAPRRLKRFIRARQGR